MHLRQMLGTKNQGCGNIPPCLSNGATDALSRADSAMGPHSEKVLWEDKTGRGGRHGRETCFNTPGRQNSPESGWKMKGGETGQKCVPLYKVFLSSSERGPLLLRSAGSIWKEPDVCNCTPVNISQALSDDGQEQQTHTKEDGNTGTSFILLKPNILSCLSVSILLWRETKQRVYRKNKSSV